MEKQLLNKLGEETLYSAKGHFKAVDIRRNLITGTIWLCVVLNIVSLFGISPIIDKYLAAIGLFGTIALLIWNAGEERDYRSKHKQAAETYLALHKEIRDYTYLTESSDEQVRQLSQRVREYDQSDKPDIPLLARKWAQKAIEKYGETDNWFLNKD